MASPKKVMKVQALDGKWYSLGEAIKWYGAQAGTRIWNEVCADPQRGGPVFMDVSPTESDDGELPCTREQGIHAGDTFRITGPRNCWFPKKRGGWQPRAWTSFPGDPASRQVRHRHLAIDFSRPFMAIEVRDVNWGFRSAKVRASNDSEQEVWINIASKGIPWVQKSR